MKTLLKISTAALLALGATLASAQGFPAKPIRLIVPSPPGDGSDLMARAISDKLTAAWGQPVVVDNKPGAGGRIGSEAAVAAPADGYTWIMGNAGSHGINAALYTNLKYDIERDFVAVTQIMRAPNVLVVNSSIPARNVSEFIAHLKANPGKYSYGSGGNGSSAHFSAELFKMAAGVDLLHVPYKGATPALTDLAAGQVAMFMGNLPPAITFISTGRAKPLGVTTLKRSPMLPDVPTIDESGLKGFETVAWFGILVPKNTPAAIVEKIHQEVAKIVQAPDIRKRITDTGGEPIGGTPAEFAAVIRNDIAKWKKVSAAANIKID